MKFNTPKLANAAAITAAILFIVCWLLAAALPEVAAAATGHMLHINMDIIERELSPMGLIHGTLCWSIGAGAAAWLMGTSYNILSGAGRKSCPEA